MNKSLAATKKTRIRRCVSCGTTSEKRDLMRVVRTPEGNVMYDKSGRANGRGAYVCCSSECIDKAKAKKLFDRSLKAEITDELYLELKEAAND